MNSIHLQAVKNPLISVAVVASKPRPRPRGWQNRTGGAFTYLEQRFDNFY